MLDRMCSGQLDIFYNNICIHLLMSGHFINKTLYTNSLASCVVIDEPLKCSIRKNIFSYRLTYRANIDGVDK